ncbi:hypothetical protein F5884DRAFT_880389 [Xylogone sp. PMI_703]|nr:hypothetical protein F5884DRAFT_880389 [Xylogone sp. PMI_703]
MFIENEDVFQPHLHLDYSAPKKKLTLQDLKLKGSPTSSEVAATVPFPLLSAEGVRAYRRSLFHPNIIEKCASTFQPGSLVLRNAAEYSKFINDFWTHPETLRIVSEAAGLPLSIVMRTEIGHTNVQCQGSTISEMVAELRAEPDTTKVELTDEERAYDPLKANSIIPWHYDSYPYVCVLMLSDTEGMVGGETYIKDGDGMPIKVEGPALGYAVFLQGGEVQHVATRGLGVKERISTITSYRANVPGLYDSSYITNIRPYSDLQVLYKEWTQYRLQKMKDEIERLQYQIAQPEGPIDVDQVAAFAESQITYIQRTARQLVPYARIQSLLERFGRMQVIKAGKIWEHAQLLPEFRQCVESVTERDWMPGSPLWLDLVETQVAIVRGEELRSQTGRFSWAKNRPFTMGDELLRQGLPEMFLDWLDCTGLWGQLHMEAYNTGF